MTPGQINAIGAVIVAAINTGALIVTGVEDLVKHIAPLFSESEPSDADIDAVLALDVVDAARRAQEAAAGLAGGGSTDDGA